MCRNVYKYMKYMTKCATKHVQMCRIHVQKEKQMFCFSFFFSKINKKPKLLSTFSLESSRVCHQNNNYNMSKTDTHKTGNMKKQNTVTTTTT